MSIISRRFLIQALPFIGAAAGIPVLSIPAEAAEPQSLQERIDHHVAALAALIDETAGQCDGWSCAIHRNPLDYDGTRVSSVRFWRVGEPVGGRFLPRDAMREFDARSGDHTDYRPMPDLSGWQEGFQHE